MKIEYNYRMQTQRDVHLFEICIKQHLKFSDYIFLIDKETNHSYNVIYNKTDGYEFEIKEFCTHLRNLGCMFNKKIKEKYVPEN